MDIKKFYAIDGEKPLDNLVSDGGFCKIFRTIACVGDSLSSGEFESLTEEGMIGYHDYFEYSWGQFMARELGSEVYNFSRGGMTASAYCESFAGQKGYWDEDKACQAYIIALGVNDISVENSKIGTIDDIVDGTGFRNNKTFAGYYAGIIQQYKSIQPDAKFFLMTMPKDDNESQNLLKEAHAKLLRDMAKHFKNTYVIDLFEYAPVYDKEFKRNFYLGGHMNPAGYALTAKMVMSYIDYIIRNNPEDFAQVGFIGKTFHNINAKW